MPAASLNYKRVSAIIGVAFSGYSKDLMTNVLKKFPGCPPELLDMYKLFGGSTLLKNGPMRFMHPRKWYRYDNRIIFAEEEQGVCCWGFTDSTECNNKGFEVLQRVANKNYWYVEPGGYGKFLIGSMFWLGVNLGERYNGVARVFIDDFKKKCSLGKRIFCRDRESVYWDPRSKMICMYFPKTPEIYVSCRLGGTLEKLKEFEDLCWL